MNQARKAIPIKVSTTTERDLTWLPTYESGEDTKKIPKARAIRISIQIVLVRAMLFNIPDVIFEITLNLIHDRGDEPVEQAGKCQDRAYYNASDGCCQANDSDDKIALRSWHRQRSPTERYHSQCDQTNGENGFLRHGN
jgi:hypothetical protein